MKSGGREIAAVAVDSIMVPLVGDVRNQPETLAPATVVAVVVSVTKISPQIACPVLLLVNNPDTPLWALVTVPELPSDTISVESSVIDGLVRPELNPEVVEPAAHKKLVAILLSP